MKVFVTGSEGKIGSRVSKELQNAGYEVIGFDKRKNAAEDITSITNVSAAIPDDCDCVIHLAAIPHPNSGTFSDYYNINVVGTKNVIESAISKGVKRFIYMSSTGYYGCDTRGTIKPKYFPIDESHPSCLLTGDYTGEIDEYNISKVMAESLIAYYGSNKKIQTVTFRSGPANSKAEQYGGGYTPKEQDGYRSGCFFTNTNPNYIPQAVKMAVESENEFYHEVFLVVDEFTHQNVNLSSFIPVDTECKNAFDIDKIKKELGFEPCQERL